MYEMPRRKLGVGVQLLVYRPPNNTVVNTAEGDPTSRSHEKRRPWDSSDEGPPTVRRAETTQNINNYCIGHTFRLAARQLLWSAPAGSVYCTVLTRTQDQNCPEPRVRGLIIPPNRPELFMQDPVFRHFQA